MSNLPRKQFGLNNADKIMSLKCEWLGYSFGVIIDLAHHTVQFDDTIPWIEPTVEGASTSSDKAEKECPGCKTGLMKLIRGGMGWAKATLGIDMVDASIVAARKETCLSCPSKCYDFGVCRDDWPNRLDAEQGCGCILSLKILQASEECPHQHWLKVVTTDA